MWIARILLNENKETKTSELEEQLVARLKAREPRAFDELYELHATSILRRLYRMIGNPVDAEDCLQQVFIEAMESLDSYRGEGVLAAWLHRIATYVAMNFFRRRSRWSSTMEKLQQFVTSNLAETIPLPPDLFEQMESRVWIRKLLDELPPLKKMAVVLCDLEGWTQEEAALHLNIPLGTLVSRLYHGRKELRRSIEHASLKAGLSIEDILHE